MPPRGQPEIRAKDEAGLASVVRWLLTIFSFFLLIPPWGFIVWFYSVKIVSEYERGVIFRLGRLVGARGPGLFVILPIVDRLVKIINAEGELQASERLAEAGRIMSEQPATLQLRFLQTLSEVATEKNSTIVFPVPVDLINLLTTGLRERAAGGDGDGARPRIRINGGGDGQAPTAPAPDETPLATPASGPLPPVEPDTREGTVS